MSETRQWVERFEALRDDLATGDLSRVQRWVQNDVALAEIAEGIAHLTRELEAARERERALRSEAQGVTRCRICCERPAALTLCTECADEALWRSIYDQWLAEEATNRSEGDD